MTFGEKIRDGARKNGADIAYLEQCALVGGHHGVQITEMRREILRSRFADVPDAQRKNETRQRRGLALLDRGHHVGGTLVGHPLQRRQLDVVQSIDIGGRLNDAAVHQLIDELVA